MLNDEARLHAAEDDRHFAAWRARELSRLVSEDTVYADYTGSALYPESLVRDDAERLCRTVLGNPHSAHAPSQRSTDALHDARRALLSFLDAPEQEYTVVFTANASAACRLVGESFPFARVSTLLLSSDNHNSVNGLREFARRGGATIRTIPLDARLRLVEPEGSLSTRVEAPSLFAMPSQSNFSGARHPLALLARARQGGYTTLLDAASSLHTRALSLRQTPADFVVLSLYKIIGYPVGVGALVARREALATLVRPWFAGGTVHWASVERAAHRLAPGAEGFEDGTPPFALAGAIPAALAALHTADRDRLARHTRSLTSALLASFRDMGAGRARVVVHGATDDPADSGADRGATVAFSLVDARGQLLPYWSVEERARRARIALRGGCFCNPGAAERAFGIGTADAGECLRRLGEAFTVPAFAACLARERGREVAVGALRVSFGLGSVAEDVRRIAEFVSECLDGRLGVSSHGSVAQVA